MPLQVQDGYRQAGLEDQMMQYLRPSEQLTGRITAWLGPPFALEYPTVERRTQLGVHLGVSNLGLNTWTLRRTGGHRIVDNHDQVGFDALGPLQVREARRAVKPTGAVRARTEAVVLMKLWAGQVELLLESRFRQAYDQGLALRDAMLAADAVRNAEPPVELRAVTGRGLLAGELANLNILFRTGALSFAEWEQAKAAYLGQPPDRRSQALSTLNELHRLYRSGALSEHEFRRKKLELLTW